MLWTNIADYAKMWRWGDTGDYSETDVVAYDGNKENDRSPVASVLLIELGGASWNVLGPLAEAGVMPHVARLLQTAAFARLNNAPLMSRSSVWATVGEGTGPAGHGILDDDYLDHRRGWIVPNCEPCPWDDAIWSRRPADFTELSRRIARTEQAFRQVVQKARDADRSSDWRLLRVRFSAVDGLLHRLWHLLELDNRPGGNRRWVAKAREAFRTLDQCLGQLIELGQSREAALVVVSPYGFVPFREKITLFELLRRSDLLRECSGFGKLGYRAGRMAWKVQRRLGRHGVPVGSLLPIDWRRSRALTLHGHSAALVYLNTPERFGTRVLRTAGQREQALADVSGALREASHPITAQRLFDDVFLTAERFDDDPLQRCWPEVIGVPREGYLVRHRPDGKGQLLRADSSLSATRGGEGLLMVCAPGLKQLGHITAEGIRPLVLGLLGDSPIASSESLLGDDRVAKDA